MFTPEEMIERFQTFRQKQIEHGTSPAQASINLALLIMSSSLLYKTTWSGRDYGEHPVRVAFNNTNSVKKIIVGLLHDVVEDSDWTCEQLRLIGFDDEIVDAVDAMTLRKEEGELYFDFIQRCSMNALALDKKLEDIQHNSDQSRAPQLLSEGRIEKLNVYNVAYYYLLEVKRGNITPGADITEVLKICPQLYDQDLFDKNSSLPSHKAADACREGSRIKRGVDVASRPGAPKAG